MIFVVTQNGLFNSIDWSKLLTQENRLVSIVGIFNSKNYFDNSK